MATMKDVARLAGVSIATVSCHLSGAKPVKPETKLKIEQAIRELKYIPNAAARQLKKADARLVGVILPDFNEHLYTEIFRGVVRYFQPQRISVSVAFSHGNAKFEQQEFYNFAHQNVMGLIVISCQPENRAFFSEWQASYHIPLIFCIHKADSDGVGYLGFDDYSSARHIASTLLTEGREDLILLTRDNRFSTEKDFARGIHDAFCASKKVIETSKRIIINGTKENAFKATVEGTNRNSLPDAILCTSSEIAKGVIEALHVLKLRVPDDILVFSLGEESWNKSEHLSGIIYTTRNATSLGLAAAQMLLNYITAPIDYPLCEKILKDRFICKSITLPCSFNSETCDVSTARSTFRFLSFFGLQEGCKTAIDNLMRIYEAETGIHISSMPQRYKSIYDSAFLKWLCYDADYDFILMDIPWKETLIRIGAIDKLDDLVDRSDYPKNRLLNCDQSSFFYKGSSYGFPMINGAQTLFYRRDLFEDSAVKDAYFKMYRSILRPPRTWHEYCRVASFFTRSYNPSSPTVWGTAEMDIDIGSLIAPNYSRFTAAGGKLVDKNGQLTLDTPSNRVAFRIALEPFKYQKGYGMRRSDITPLDSFCLGETAMCITFNDSATRIRDAINRNQIGQLGYAEPPEGHSIRAGWGIGIRPGSTHREEIYDFFKWFMRTDISYYYTIVSGNTTCKRPYLNGEILDLYPWMGLFPNGECVYSKRVPWSHIGNMEVPNIHLEYMFCSILISLTETTDPIEKVLSDAEHELMKNKFDKEFRT